MNCRNILFLSALCLLLASCVSRTRYAETERILDSLLVENSRHQAEANSLNQFIDVLAESLDSISTQEDVLLLPHPENGKLKSVTRRQMLDNINAFEQILQRQKDRIKMLEDSLAKTEDYGKLKVVISHLNAQLLEKENEIDRMRMEISRKDANIARLKEEVKTLNDDIVEYQEKDAVNQQILAAQDEYLNQGHYLVATRMELSESGVARNGKLLGTLDENDFTVVDIRDFTQLTIQSPKARILSNMPKASYTLTKNADGTVTLDILDSAEFWRMSRYLIIQIR